MTGTTKTLKNGKIQYYYKDTLLRTSCTNYKYALIKENEFGIRAMKFSNSIDVIISQWRYLTKGYGLKFEESNLASSQFHNPVELEIVEF